MAKLLFSNYVLLASIFLKKFTLEDDMNEVLRKPELSVLTKIANIFFSPRATFLSINQKPDWIIPMTIVLIVILFFIIATLPISMPQQLEKMRLQQEEKGLSPEQTQQVMELGEKYGKRIGPVFAVIGGVLYLCGLSGIFLFFGNFILGGKTTFVSILSVVCYTSLIGSVNSLLLLPMILAKKTMYLSFSLAALLPTAATDTFRYQLLSKIDLFAIWQIIVAGIGLAVIYQFSTKKSITMVASVYLIYVIISLAIFSIFN